MKTISFILFILFFYGTSLQAKDLVFDLKFLPKETVLPLVADKVFVKNKNILLDGRFSVGLGAGFILTEALFKQASASFNLRYNFTEVHAISLNYIYKISGLSNGGKSAEARQGGGKFQLNRAPYIKAFHFGLYKYTAYYGKISLSHNSVMNLTTSVNMGGGVAQYSDAVFPLMALSVDQNFYFNSSLALNFIMGLFVYQGGDFFCPDKEDCNGRPGHSGVDGSGTGDILSKNLNKIWYQHTYLELGLVYLF